MKRSEFLKIVGGTLIASQLPQVLNAKSIAANRSTLSTNGMMPSSASAQRGEVVPNIKLDIRPLTIAAGAEKPF